MMRFAVFNGPVRFMITGLFSEVVVFVQFALCKVFDYEEWDE